MGNKPFVAVCVRVCRGSFITQMRQGEKDNVILGLFKSRPGQSSRSDRIPRSDRIVLDSFFRSSGDKFREGLRNRTSFQLEMSSFDLSIISNGTRLVFFAGNALQQCET